MKKIIFLLGLFLIWYVSFCDGLPMRNDPGRTRIESNHLVPDTSFYYGNGGFFKKQNLYVFLESEFDEDSISIYSESSNLRWSSKAKTDLSTGSAGIIDLGSLRDWGGLKIEVNGCLSLNIEDNYPTNLLSLNLYGDTLLEVIFLKSPPIYQ